MESETEEPSLEGVAPNPSAEDVPEASHSETEEPSLEGGAPNPNDEDVPEALHSAVNDDAVAGDVLAQTTDSLELPSVTQEEDKKGENDSDLKPGNEEHAVSGALETLENSDNRPREEAAVVRPSSEDGDWERIEVLPPRSGTSSPELVSDNTPSLSETTRGILEQLRTSTDSVLQNLLNMTQSEFEEAQAASLATTLAKSAEQEKSLLVELSQPLPAGSSGVVVDRNVPQKHKTSVAQPQPQPQPQSRPQPQPGEWKDRAPDDPLNSWAKGPLRNTLDSLITASLAECERVEKLTRVPTRVIGELGGHLASSDFDAAEEARRREEEARKEPPFRSRYEEVLLAVDKDLHHGEPPRQIDQWWHLEQERGGAADGSDTAQLRVGTATRERAAPSSYHNIYLRETQPLSSYAELPRAEVAAAPPPSWEGVEMTLDGMLGMQLHSMADSVNAAARNRLGRLLEDVMVTQAPGEARTGGSALPVVVPPGATRKITGAEREEEARRRRRGGGEWEWEAVVGGDGGRGEGGGGDVESRPDACSVRVRLGGRYLPRWEEEGEFSLQVRQDMAASTKQPLRRFEYAGVEEGGGGGKGAVAIRVNVLPADAKGQAGAGKTVETTAWEVATELVKQGHDGRSALRGSRSLWNAVDVALEPYVGVRVEQRALLRRQAVETLARLLTDMEGQVLDSPERAIPAGKAKTLLKHVNAARGRLQGGDAGGVRKELERMKGVLAEAGSEAAAAQAVKEAEEKARKLLREAMLGAKSADALAVERMVAEAEEMLSGAEGALGKAKEVLQGVVDKAGGSPPGWWKGMAGADGEGGEVGQCGAAVERARMRMVLAKSEEADERGRGSEASGGGGKGGGGGGGSGEAREGRVPATGPQRASQRPPEVKAAETSAATAQTEATFLLPQGDPAPAFLTYLSPWTWTPQGREQVGWGGLFAALGSALAAAADPSSGGEGWVNPAEASLVRAVGAPWAVGAVHNVLDPPFAGARGAGVERAGCASAESESAWFCIELPPWLWVYPTHYAMADALPGPAPLPVGAVVQQGPGGLRPVGGDEVRGLRGEKFGMPRSWRLEASADGARWEVLSRHEREEAMRRGGGAAVWSLDTRGLGAGGPFRFFRVTMEGVNSGGGRSLCCRGFEIYGAVGPVRRGEVLESAGRVLRAYGHCVKGQEAAGEGRLEEGAREFSLAQPLFQLGPLPLLHGGPGQKFQGSGLRVGAGVEAGRAEGAAGRERLCEAMRGRTLDAWALMSEGDTRARYSRVGGGQSSGAQLGGGQARGSGGGVWVQGSGWCAGGCEAAERRYAEAEAVLRDEVGDMEGAMDAAAKRLEAAARQGNGLVGVAEAVERVVADGHAMPFSDPEPVEAARAQGKPGRGRIGGGLTVADLAGKAASIAVAGKWQKAAALGGGGGGGGAEGDEGRRDEGGGAEGKGKAAGEQGVGGSGGSGAELDAWAEREQRERTRELEEQREAMKRAVTELTEKANKALTDAKAALADPDAAKHDLVKARGELVKASEAFAVIDLESAAGLQELEEGDREAMGLGKSLAQAGSGGDAKALSKVQGLLPPEELRKQIQETRGKLEEEEGAVLGRVGEALQAAKDALGEGSVRDARGQLKQAREGLGQLGALRLAEVQEALQLEGSRAEEYKGHAARLSELEGEARQQAGALVREGDALRAEAARKREEGDIAQAILLTKKSQEVLERADAVTSGAKPPEGGEPAKKKK